MHPPITDHPASIRAAAMAAHPAGGPSTPEPADEGSLVAEYGLVTVIGATVAALAIKWASGGSIFDLFGAVLRKVKVLVGA